MRAAPALVLALALALAACGSKQSNQQQAEQPASNQVLKANGAGVTPMKDRVAVIGVLNKRNGIVRNLRMKPGQAVRIDDDATVRLLACEKTAPWEPETLTGAFLQLDVKGRDKKWRRVFSGWVYKESPSLNVVEHPVYDVWPKICAMSFPPGPPPPTPPRASSSSRSSAQKSPGPQSEAPAPESSPTTPSPSPPSAAANTAA